MQLNKWPLRRDGHLFNSIGLQVAGRAVIVGAKIEYAPFHQYGTKTRAGKTHIPARRFLPIRGKGAASIPKKWRTAIAEAALTAIRKIIK